MLQSLAADLVAGFGLLTRLPVFWMLPAATPYRPGRAVWTYPLVGLTIGAVAGLVLWRGGQAGLPPLLDAVWAATVAVVLTGGLHEDGLADSADGLAGGRTPERRLEIMRDSRIGSYGTLALLLSLGIRVTAIAALPPSHGIAVLAATAAVARAAMLPLLLLPPARADGLSRSLGRVPRPALCAGILIAVGAAVVLLSPLRGLAVASAAMLVAAATATLGRMRIGGQTGDLLGAAAIAAECIGLTLVVVLPPR